MARPARHCAATKPIPGIRTRRAPCRSFAQAGSQFCTMHDPGRSRCQGFRMDGSRCRRYAKRLMMYCPWHEEHGPGAPADRQCGIDGCGREGHERVMNDRDQDLRLIRICHEHERQLLASGAGGSEPR